MSYFVYILASRRYGTLYVGVTNSLERRIAQHKRKDIPGFTKRYGVDRLVYFRIFDVIGAAIKFEKRLKRWRRDWKIRLIEEDNPHWDDLHRQMMALPPAHPALMGPGLSPAAKTGMTDVELTGVVASLPTRAGRGDLLV